MSILTLNKVSLKVGGQLILDEVDWQIEAQDKIALIGRNGMGKSSLLKLIQKHLFADSGQIHQVQGLTIGALSQEVPQQQIQDSVYAFLVKGLKEKGEVIAEYHRLLQQGDMAALAECQLQLDALNAWDYLPKIEMFASRLGIDTTATMSALSGGMKRRVLLAAALIAEPQLLLLDEPTNHLDLHTIEWLESYLKAYSGCLIVVTHDRQFLEAVANRIVEIDRGKLFNYPGNFQAYLEQKEAKNHAENKQNSLFDKRLQEEEIWIRTGIQARRTRNEGRVRALKAMREQHKARRQQLGKVKGIALNQTRSGTLVLTAEKVHFAYEDRTLVQDFSLVLTRGDKLGIIGPNGCGKTTLLRLLLGELTPQSGLIKAGTALNIAYFDQLRDQLDENASVLNNVAEGADYVTLGGQQKHVAAYLKEFLFTPERFNQAVSTLSGGERNRLLLAKLLAKPVNLLVMDEPTNDLDMETLELLESKLIDYTGTLLLISHDRAFINQVVTSVLAWEGEGVFNEYVGDYEDYVRQKRPITNKTSLKSEPPPKLKSTKLNYKEQRELAALPNTIEKLEQKIMEVQLQMSTPEFYQQDVAFIGQLSKQLLLDEATLAQLYARWEVLSQGE